MNTSWKNLIVKGKSEAGEFKNFQEKSLVQENRIKSENVKCLKLIY